MEIFYSPDLTESSSIVTLTEGESHHLRRVLRKNIGDSVQIANGKGIMAEAGVFQETSGRIVCKIRQTERVPAPVSRNIRVAISTIRPNRMDWAVEKLTESGVGGIQFLYCDYTSVRACKEKHLQKIAVSAMKQSEQAYLPHLSPPLDFRKWLNGFEPPGKQLRLMAHPETQAKLLTQIKLTSDFPVIIAIGPEGGFSPEEASLAHRAGFQSIKLAEQVLRTETAAAAAAAQLNLLFLSRS